MTNDTSTSTSPTTVALIFLVVALVLGLGGTYLYLSRSNSSEVTTLPYGLQSDQGNANLNSSGTTTSTSNALPATLNKNLKHMVTISTSLGDITLQLDPAMAPNTVANFEKLAQAGFYDGTLFHRVIPGFMIQGGDPLTKSDPKNWAIHGTGGPGYKFADEIGPNSSNKLGSIAMANSGPNTNGSQFYINTVDNLSLDGSYTVFGQVISGLDVAQKIQNVKRDDRDHPLEDVVIKKVTVQ